MRTLARYALIISIALFEGCSGSQPPIGAPRVTPQAPTTREAARQAVARSGDSGPFLYVAGVKLSMYRLGSSKPLHVAKVNPSSFAEYALALDLHGHLCESNEELTDATLFEYDAHNLKFVNGVSGIEVSPLAADHLGYLYASTPGSGIFVFAPGCLHQVNVIRRGASNFGSLVFDHSGNLYKGNGAPNDVVSVYAPTNKPGRMRLIHQIRNGISAPGALAIGPSGDLFVANYSYSEKNSYITVYRPGGSKPVRTITKGMKVAGALAVDSTGRLYVGVGNYNGVRRGWISVYAPGGTQPLRKVRVHDPITLALDSSDHLYVMDTYLFAAGSAHQSTVLVYNPGATKLLQTIKDGVDRATALLIGSP